MLLKTRQKQVEKVVIAPLIENSVGNEMKFMSREEVLTWQIRKKEIDD
jgi:hypothetical protein